MAYTPSAIPHDAPPGLGAWLSNELRRISYEFDHLRVFTAGDPRRLRKPDAGVYTFGIPSDFPSLQAAIDKLTRRPALGERIVLQIETGTELEGQLLISGGVDLSHITITAEDEEVTVVQSTLTRQLPGTTEGRFPFMGATGRSVLPIVECLFVGDGSGSGNEREAFRLADGSGLIIRPGGGFKNSAARGAYLTSASWLVARGAIFDNANDRAVWARFGCYVDFVGGSAVNAGWTAFQMHSSYGDCENATLTGAGHYGIRARRNSSINAEGANFSNANEHGINCNEGSTINARNATGTDCGEHGIQVTEGSRVEARGVNVSGAGWAGVFATGGSTIDFRQGDASNSGGNGFAAIHVQRGSIINAHEATGTLSQTANTLTAAGIIFQEE